MGNIYTNNLTIKNRDGSYRAPVAENDETIVYRVSDRMFSCYKGELVDRLGEFEEIGLEPNEVAELKSIKDNLEYKVKQLEEQIKWNRKLK
ncbi:hypothetical protein TPDSL_13780 [Terrisporobacter petrolearius]|uniref:hypothetical protein n=1 Tax=Terrisporobacter petrolearius TaxID=1460447 RepID=UPI0033665563